MLFYTITTYFLNFVIWQPSIQAAAFKTTNMAKLIETSTVFSPADLTDYAPGSIVSGQLTMSKAGNITLFAFDEEQHISEHEAPFDAVVQVLEGKGRITIAGKDHELSAGQMIIMPANVPHAVTAITAFKMMLIMIRG